MSTGRTSTHADRSPLYADSKMPLFLFLRSRTPDDGCTEHSEGRLLALCTAGPALVPAAASCAPYAPRLRDPCDLRVQRVGGCVQCANVPLQALTLSRGILPRLARTRPGHANCVCLLLSRGARARMRVVVRSSALTLLFYLISSLTLLFYPPQSVLPVQKMDLASPD